MYALSFMVQYIFINIFCAMHMKKPSQFGNFVLTTLFGGARILWANIVNVAKYACSVIVDAGCEEPN